MCETGVWDRDITTVLIMAYETCPNLYVTKDKEYKLKNRRMDSLNYVKKILSDSGADLSIEEINKKIHTLRTQFFKEYAKVKKSIVSGAGTENIYVPKLWCYDLLKFLVTSDPVRNSTSNLDMENLKPSRNTDVFPAYSNSTLNPTETRDLTQPGCSWYTQNDDAPQAGEILYDGPSENVEKGVYITPPAKKIKKPSKNTMEKEALQLISNASSVLNTISNNQKIKNDKEVAVHEDVRAFGSVIIEELKKIKDEDEMRIAKREILNSVFNAQERAATKHK